MSILIEFPEVEQRSEEWHAQRRGMVTASAVGQLITAKTLKPANNDISRGLTRLLVAERITGWTDPTFISAEMFRGIEDEPRARDLISEEVTPIRETGFMVREFDNGHRLGFSPDGLVDDDGFIEVKSRKQKKQLETVLEDAVPPENMAQIQCGLLVSGRKWCEYISYCGGMEVYPIRVLPDPAWFAAIIAALDQFERNAAEMVATYMKRTAGLPVAERVLEQEIF